MSAMNRVVAVIAGMTCLCAGGAMAAEPEQPAGYHVLKKAKVGGEGRWDDLKVDEASHRLFVPRSTRVDVLDLASDDLKVVGEISGTGGVHAVAIAPKAGRCFTSNGQDGTASIVDLKTLKTLTKVKTGEGPDLIVFDPATNNVFVMNHRGGTITAFAADADVAQPVKTTEIPVGGTLEFAAVDGAGHLYVNVEDKSEVVAVDTREMKVLGHWPLKEGEEPTGLAIDPQKGLLFAACHNRKMVVLDAKSGEIVGTLPIGGNVDGCAADPERELVFTSNGDGTMTVVSDHDPAHPALVGNLATQAGARTVALDSTAHRLYLPTAEFGQAQGGGRPAMVSNSFMIVVVGRE